MFFTSDENGHQLVPNEGVIAAIEVKTSIAASKAQEIYDNMMSVKTLDKSAYYISSGPITSSTNIYGQKFSVAPTLYFLFAFEGGESSAVAAALNTLQDQNPIEQRVDCGCILDQGWLLNALSGGQVSGLSEPGSVFVGYPTEHALLMFYIFAARFLLQISHRAINVQKYIPASFQF